MRYPSDRGDSSAGRGLRVLPAGLNATDSLVPSPTGRAIMDRQTIHVHDIVAEIETEYPESKMPQQLTGTRTLLAMPLLREGIPIG